MPTPFSYDARLRFTPKAGPSIVYPISFFDFPTVIRSNAEPIFLQKETINRGIRNTPLGWRLSLTFVIQTPAGSATEDLMVGIGKRLMVLGEKMEVTLDGSFYREAHLTSWQRTLDEDKNVDVIYQVGIVVAELLTENVVAPETLTSPAVVSGWA